MTDSAADGAPPAGMGDTTYDAVPYESHSFADTHPDRMATIAALFGLEAPAPETARVLELGCASGGNLLPMAQSLPDAAFVGIDLSARQIGDGRAALEATGLTNVDLQHRSILDIGPDDGRFDYVICHGVYSWVPPEVQRKILAICRENLEPSGVAFVSYNTFPGWHMRATVREMMNYHAARFDDVQAKIDQSRALLSFLTSAVPEDGGAYSLLLRNELEILKERYDSYLFHEHLEEYNEPLYFFRFVERAKEAGLRYLGEAGFDVMTDSGLEEGARKTLHEIAADIIHFEQYMDFLRNRMFRRTLLCHAGVTPDRAIGPGRVRRLRVASAMQPPPDGCDLESERPAEFRHASRGTAPILKPIQKAALLHLWDQWPTSMPLAEVAEGALERLGGDRPTRETAEQEIEELVLTCFPSGHVEVHARPSRFVREGGERPRTPVFTRHQAERALVVTNLRHEMTRVDELQRRVLTLLDGERDVPAVEEALVSVVADGEVTLHREDQEVTDEDTIRELIHEALPHVLQKVTQKALLAE
jgi:methyltransferase-like protein/cyclopropane fatty-acyl-phospholipid synthase-like methyltransferase